MGRKFKLRTDLLSLKYLFNYPNLNARQARWLEFLCEFEFDIKHMKGKENKVVYALSRRFHVEAVSTYQTDFKAKILQVIASDEYTL